MPSALDMRQLARTGMSEQGPWDAGKANFRVIVALAVEDKVTVTLSPAKTFRRRDRGSCRNLQ